MLIAAAVPAWSASPTCDARRDRVSDPGARFEAHDDGTVVDRRSRLMWMRCSAGQTWSGRDCVGDARALDFRTALSMADEINRSGALFFGDWRLPRASELATLSERSCDDPRIDLATFPATPAEFYWSTTTRPRAMDGFVYALSFGREGIRYLDKEQAVHLRLVRDAR